MECFERALQSNTGAIILKQQDSVEFRAERAEVLVQVGEVSVGREVLEGAPLAPGEKQNPVRRPLVPRAPIPVDLLSVEPEHPSFWTCSS